MGPQRLRQVGEIRTVMQAESESSLVNQRLKKNSNCEQHRKLQARSSSCVELSHRVAYLWSDSVKDSEVPTPTDALNSYLWLAIKLRLHQSIPPFGIRNGSRLRVRKTKPVNER